MKQTLFTFMFIISLVLMTACGGSPVDKALAKLVKPWQNWMMPLKSWRKKEIR